MCSAMTCLSSAVTAGRSPVSTDSACVAVHDQRAVTASLTSTTRTPWPWPAGAETPIDAPPCRCLRDGSRLRRVDASMSVMPRLCKDCWHWHCPVLPAAVEAVADAGETAAVAAEH